MLQCLFNQIETPNSSSQSKVHQSITRQETMQAELKAAISVPGSQGFNRTLSLDHLSSDCCGSSVFSSLTSVEVFGNAWADDLDRQGSTRG